MGVTYNSLTQNMLNGHDDMLDAMSQITGATQTATDINYQKQAMDQLSSYYKNRLDSLAYDAMNHQTAKEEDFEVLRDFLVDMCAGTFSEEAPSQEEWTKLRDLVKATAVEHALLNREEKKAVKKPGLFGAGIAGDRVLEGNEEALRIFQR